VDVTGTSKGRGFAASCGGIIVGRVPSRTGTCSRCRARSGRSSFPFARVPGAENAGTHGRGQGDGADLRIRGIDLDENLIMVEGAVPGTRDGYVLITSKSKLRRASAVEFAGGGTGGST